MGALGGDDRAGRVSDLYHRYREALQRVREAVDDPASLQAASDEVVALGAEIDALARDDRIDLTDQPHDATRP